MFELLPFLRPAAVLRKTVLLVCQTDRRYVGTPVKKTFESHEPAYEDEEPLTASLCLLFFHTPYLLEAVWRTLLF